MTIYHAYLAGLAECFPPDARTLLATLSGADESDIAELVRHYPDVPADLLGLLSRIKGTHYERHQDRTVYLPVLGSDVEEGEYPYYLRSVQQILKDKNDVFGQETIHKIYGKDGDFVEVDERIDITAPFHRWLCFAHCVNNGGTSQLYIDFSPSESGINGQVVRFLHDPDSYLVIADNFSEYLQYIMQGGICSSTPTRWLKSTIVKRINHDVKSLSH